MSTGELNGGVTLQWTNIQGGGGVEILLIASSWRNGDKLRYHEPYDPYADFAFYFLLYLYQMSIDIIRIQSEEWSSQ